MPDSEHCWSHDASFADERRRRASRGGRRGGRGRPSTELTHLRVENADIRKLLKSGDMEPKVASVLIQSLNVDARLISTLLDAREQEELVSRMEELEEMVSQQSEERQASGGF
jgi:hypothetical protein